MCVRHKILLLSVKFTIGRKDTNLLSIAKEKKHFSFTLSQTLDFFQVLDNTSFLK